VPKQPSQADAAGWDELQQDVAELEAMLAKVRAVLAQVNDGARRLANATGLTGTTKDRARQGLEVLGWIHEQAACIDRLLGQAKAIRPHSAGLGWGRPTDELRQLLHEPSLPTQPPMALLAPGEAPRRVKMPDQMTPRELLAEMVQAADLVRADVELVEKRWNHDLPKLKRDVEAVNEGASKVLDDEDSRRSRARSHNHLVARVETDPLSVEEDELDEVAHASESARYWDKPPGDTAALEAELGTAEPRLHKLQRLIQQAGADSVDARETIVKPRGLVELIDEVCLVDQDHGPIPWLERIRGTAATGRSRDAAEELQLWQRAMEAWIEDASRIAEANQAPSRAREELRTLLLTLQAKAEDRGVASDEALVASKAQANACLHAVPTDLMEARALVHEFGVLLAMRT
jgi:hypothetical protein